jgi:hypothetical protein
MSEHPSDHDLWAGAAAAHVDTCEACRRRLRVVQQQQHEVSAALQALAGPVPLPANVEQRMHATVTQQVAERDGAVVRLAAPRRGRWLAGAGIAAAAVVVAGVMLPPLLRDQGLGADTTGRTAGGAAEEAAPEAGAGEAGGADGDAAGSGVLTVSPLPTDLQRAARALPTDATSTCGAVLADEVGGEVQASAQPAAPDREGVLVVVDGPDGRTAWWLPACDAGTAQAWGSSPLG